MNKLNSFYFGLLDLQTRRRHEFLESKTTLEGNPYIMMQLQQRMQNIVIQGVTYRIRSHHLSIYDDYRTFSRNSDAHYTAELSPVDGDDLYHLHVYFDEQDRPIGLPSLMKVVKKVSKGRSSDRKSTLKEKEFLEIEEESSLQLSALALSASTLILSGLRREHQKRISVVESELTQLLQDFSMPTTQTDIERCLVRLDKNIRNSLLLYNKTFHKWLVSMKEDVLWRQAELTQEAYFTMSVPISKEPILSAAVPIEKQASKHVPLKKKDKTIKDVVMDPLQDAVQHMEACQERYEKASSRVKSLNALMTYFESIQEAYALIDTKKHTRYSSFITKSLLSTQLVCARRLIDALREKDNGSVDKLKGFARFLPDQEVIHALERNDAEALLVLLDNGVFPLNRIQCVLDDGIQEATLLEYAYQQGFYECFDVLLAHGASLLTKVMDGFPLADRIFSSGSSPFLRSLDTHCHGRQRAVLLKSLCSMMRSADFEYSTDLDARINLYEVRAQQLDSLSTNCFVTSKAALSQASEDIDRLRKSTEHLKIDALIRTSPDLQVLQTRSFKAYTEYFNKLTKWEQQKDKYANAKFLSDLADRIHTLQEDLTQSELHDALVRHYESLISFYPLHTERLALAVELKKFKISALRPNQLKEYKRLSARHDSLVREIEAQTITIEKMELRKKMQEQTGALMNSLLELSETMGHVLDSKVIGALKDQSFFRNPSAMMTLGLDLINTGMQRMALDEASDDSDRTDSIGLQDRVVTGHREIAEEFFTGFPPSSLFDDPETYFQRHPHVHSNAPNKNDADDNQALVVYQPS